MDDVFMNTEHKNSTQKNAKKTSHRRFKQYLADLIIKSLLVASLFAIDFNLFIQAGSYSVFDINQIMALEAYWIYISILVASIVLVFLCSFSQTLQNLLVGLSVSFIFLALLNQFALFNPGAMLLSYIPQTDGPLIDFMGMYSHLVIAGILTIFVTCLLTYIKRKTQFYILISLILIGLLTLSGAYFNPVTRNFIEKPYLNDESIHTDSHNIIYIGLNNAITFSRLKSLDPKDIRSDIKQSADNLLGFYQKNNFTYYPSSYLKYVKQPYLNLVSILNANMASSPEDLLLADIITNGYWDFKTLRKEKLYLRNNSFFDKYHKKDYNLRIYQQDGVELCTINNNLSVNRCVEQVGAPVNFTITQLTLGEKISLLAAQWLESTGIIPTIDPILGIVSAFNRDIVPLHFSSKNLGSYNAFIGLNRIAEDIVNDHGNNIYFTTINIPGNLFIYDNLCSIKPIKRWIDTNDTTINQLDKYAAYAEQNSCLYGQLENFMQKLQSSGKLNQTTVIIQGLNAAFSVTPGIEKDILKGVQNTKQAGLAVYTPHNPQANIDNRLCLASSLLNSITGSQNSCSELEDLALTDKLKADILKQNKKQEISTQQVEGAIKSFKNWYKSWAAQNQVANNTDDEIIPIEKAPVTEKEIVEAPIAEAVDELPPENPTKPIKTSSSKTTEKKQDKTTEQIKEINNNTLTEESKNTTEKKNEVFSDINKPEQLKKEFKEQQENNRAVTIPTTTPSVNVEVKVIDKTESNNTTLQPSVLVDIHQNSPQN